jgi:plasmid stabilization system protein ParE
MRIVFDREAENDLANQLDYIVAQGAAHAARRLEQRLLSYIENTVAHYPRSAAFVAHRGLWETWVPNTRLIIWYRFTADELQIVRVWHTSQDREQA